MQALERIGGYGHVALRYGLEEAIFLDSIMYWYKENRANGRNYRDGRWWTYNSVSAFTQLFPWWSAKQLRRISESCRTQGAILAGNYNEDQRDRTLWYSPSDELLALYGLDGCGDEPSQDPGSRQNCAGPGAEPDAHTGDGSGNCIGRNGPMDSTERANMSAQMGKCNIEHVQTHVQTHEETPLPPKSAEASSPAADDPPLPPKREASAGKKRPSRRAGPKAAPDWKPDRFAKFWDYYPRGEDKQAAIRAWDKLQPSDELINEMAQALQRQMASEDWQEGIGIPYASTWLNKQRWTDEPKAVQASGADAPLRGEGVDYT